MLMPKVESNPARILVVGAGELGMSMLRALAEHNSDRAGSPMVLLRPAAPDEEDSAQRSQAAVLRNMGVGIVRADLAMETVAGLAAILAAFSTVICCTGFVGGPGTQRKITAAILEAGVERYIPWQFGIDYDVVGRGSGQQVFDEQCDVRDMLRAQSGTHWIIVSTGMFTSFLFESSFGLVDLERGRVHALGSWENRLTVTTAEDIGRLTAAILAQEPRVDDEVVFVAGHTLSYAELADLVEQHLGRTVDRTLWTREMLQAEVAAYPDDGMRKYHLAFAREDGVAWDKERTFNFTHGMAVADVPAWLKQHKPVPGTLRFS